MEPDQRKRSFPPVVDAGARLLVLGSLPGERSLAAGRYYAHPRNQFWQLIGAAVEVELDALPYDERLAALLRHGVGLWDVVASAERRGSTDAAIRDEVPNDVVRLAESLPRLRAVAFNGGTAARLGLAALGNRAAGVERVTLPSSSPLHTVPIAAKLPPWRALRRFLTG